MMTDPIADLATRIRNANVAYHSQVEIPHSRLKAGILNILVREGFVRAVSPTEQNGKKTLRVSLHYGPNRERILSGLRRISRPGLRTYVMRGALPIGRAGSGRIAILTTSQGLMTASEAHKKGIGGEFLVEAW